MAFSEAKATGSIAYKYSFRVTSILGSTVRVLWEGDSMAEAEETARELAMRARSTGSPETIALDSFRVELSRTWVQRLLLSRPPSVTPIRKIVGQRGKPRVLFLPMEFPSWHNGGHSWSFGAQLAYEEGLRANGCEVTTINTACAPFHQKILRGKRFDQVWLHCHPRHLDDFAFRTWVSDIAPVRMLLCGETVNYPETDGAASPWLPAHTGTFAKWAPHVTHAAFVDPADVAHAPANIKTTWWQQAVPKRFVMPVNERPTKDSAVFVGTLYPPRDRWVFDLGGLIERVESPESDLFQWAFDRSHDWIQRKLDRIPDAFGLGPGPAPAYPHAWKVKALLGLYNRFQVGLRSHALGNFIGALRVGVATVNLPSQLRTYSGRIYEGIAAGRPVLTQRPPDHPNVFEEDEIIHYRDVEDLADWIRLMKAEPETAVKIARRARAAVIAKHTVEIRTKELLAFVDGGHVAP